MLEERKYNVMQKYQYFNGVKFTRDEKSGYYLNSSIRKRMHRYVWEYYNGEIPEGYQIHHIDKDRSNNDISNLELIPFTEHAKLHNKEKAITRHAEIVQNIKENVLPKAIEWHKSDEGRQWHSEKQKHKWMKEHIKHLFVKNVENILKARQSKHQNTAAMLVNPRQEGGIEQMMKQESARCAEKNS